MPCFLTQRITVDLTKVDPTFVLDALRALDGGWGAAFTSNYGLVNLGTGETVVYRDGKLNISARSTERTGEIEDEVKRGISNAVVTAAAKKFRWTLKADTKKRNEYDVEKRGF